jgi:uncharacterized protein YneF (UPF0154 family)
MVGLIVTVIVVVCLVGGVFYGFNYLRAKANKTSVSSELVKSVDDLIKKP